MKFAPEFVKPEKNLCFLPNANCTKKQGYGNGNWTKLMTISANASTMTNITHCYLATEVERISTQHLEETEDLTVHLLDEEEVKALLLNDEVKQSLMAAPFWKYFALYSRL